jgi:hypothetical protein
MRRIASAAFAKPFSAVPRTKARFQQLGARPRSATRRTHALLGSPQTKVACLQQPSPRGRRKPLLVVCYEPVLAVLSPAYGAALRGGEVLPHVPHILQLEDATFIRVQEVVPVRDPVAVRRLDLAPLPACWGHAPAVRLAVGNHVDSVLYAVLNTRGSGWYQSPGSLSLLCHIAFDARALISGYLSLAKVRLNQPEITKNCNLRSLQPL